MSLQSPSNQSVVIRGAQGMDGVAFPTDVIAALLYSVLREGYSRTRPLESAYS